MSTKNIIKAETRIGKISNYYGGLWVKQEGRRYYFSIENYAGDEWEEISETLYNELLKHNKK